MEIKEYNTNNEYGICIYCEKSNGIINSVSLELATKAAELAKNLNTKLSAVIFNGNDDDYSSLHDYGVDMICNYSLDTANSYYYIQEEIIVKGIIDFTNQYFPKIMLIGSTLSGKQVASRLGAIYETGLTADCIDLKIDPISKNLIQIRPAQEYSVIASIICPNNLPQMATIRPNTFMKKKLKKGTPV